MDPKADVMRLDKEKRLEKFLAYCRRVLRNANTDVMRARARRAKRAVPLSGLTERELGRLSRPFDFREEECVEALGWRVTVLGAALAEAIRSLPDEERAAVLLHYFAGWPDRRVADELGCSRSTAQARRARALALLREVMGEGADADDYL